MHKATIKNDCFENETSGNYKYMNMNNKMQTAEPAILLQYFMLILRKSSKITFIFSSEYFIHSLF